MQSISNAEIKRIRSLAQKKYRDEYGLFVVEGEKMVAEAMDSGMEVTAVYRRDEIGEAAMARISLLSSPSPVLALVRKPSGVRSGSPEGIIRNGLYLALDTIRDPGNLGTILRVADWFGADAVFASPDTADIFNPKVVQSTMGAIFRVGFHIPTFLPCAVRYPLSAAGSTAPSLTDTTSIRPRWRPERIARCFWLPETNRKGFPVKSPPFVPTGC